MKNQPAQNITDFLNLSNDIWLRVLVSLFYLENKRKKKKKKIKSSQTLLCYKKYLKLATLTDFRDLIFKRVNNQLEDKVLIFLKDNIFLFAVGFYSSRRRKKKKRRKKQWRESSKQVPSTANPSTMMNQSFFTV
jgi:hypothetical protein